MKKFFIKKTIEDYAPEPWGTSWGTFFQDNATPEMERLQELHNNIMFSLAILLIAVSWTTISVIISFKYKNSTFNHTSGTINRFIWTFCPALILILILMPCFKLLYLMDEIVDPALVIHGEGHEWYWSYDYPDFVEVEEKKIVPDVLFMENDPTRGIPRLNGHLPGMPEYAAYLQQHEGKTLKQIGIDTNAWTATTTTRANFLTWYFIKHDPGAFMYKDADNTVITDFFIHRAMTLHSRVWTYNPYNWF